MKKFPTLHLAYSYAVMFGVTILYPYDREVAEWAIDYAQDHINETGTDPKVFAVIAEAIEEINPETDPVIIMALADAIVIATTHYDHVPDHIFKWAVNKSIQELVVKSVPYGHGELFGVAVNHIKESA